ncbi:MAG: SRPBCC domain-containing protein [Phenylobacterium sp.]|jgi:uncharacterized protein YndB with AHSA1/START domain|uniref:SRPBCC family protein n=1 Tax=unclassified Phenylobacterium TaxID=2640670 RepID=UPI0008C39651|nr:MULTISPECIES: SRPBCC domain-containing protein [unclassified Phenylobacterium]MBJ7409790.1 SRPBCC domain-containing protein [Phenylobacterium sp.]OHB30590.1 MAG: polyketide cyclase [Phenylobacterium sp. RIFCSPHIGHO2_01_FULL_69_31]
MSRSVVVEREIPHAPEKVWRALTEGPLIEDWLMSNDFAPVVGHRFRFRGQPAPPHWDGIVEAEVLAVEPPSRLAYTWVAGGLSTEVTWTLTATDRGAHVRMEQSGFGPDDTRNAAGATYGWQRNLEALERVVGGLS